MGAGPIAALDTMLWIDSRAMSTRGWPPLTRRLGHPSAGVDEVRADRDVEVANCPGCSAEIDLQGRRNSSFGNPNQPANTDKSRIVARPLIE
jgi:hypothetical protein